MVAADVRSLSQRPPFAVAADVSRLKYQEFRRVRADSRPLLRGFGTSSNSLEAVAKVLVLHLCRKLCRNLSGHGRKSRDVCGGSFRPRRRCSLLTDPLAGYARRSRLAWAKNSSPQTSPKLRP